MALSWTGVIFVNPEGRILLLLRDDIPTIGHPGHWNLVGGVIEDGETPEEAAIREVEEEIGVRLESVAPFRFYSIADGRFAAPVPYWVYWSRLDRPLEQLTLGEGQDMRFFAPEELPGLRIVPHEVGILQEFIASSYYVVNTS